LDAIIIMFNATGKDKQLQPWTVAHLATEEPDAEPYLQHDDADWDGSTLASTPSMKRIPTVATILRDRGEPSDIIISIEHKLSFSKRVLRRLWNLLCTLYERINTRRILSSGISNSSTEQPSLGVMGVIV
jgi:hypothetical protein